MTDTKMQSIHSALLALRDAVDQLCKATDPTQGAETQNETPAPKSAAKKPTKPAAAAAPAKGKGPSKRECIAEALAQALTSGMAKQVKRLMGGTALEDMDDADLTELESELLELLEIDALPVPTAEVVQPKAKAKPAEEEEEDEAPEAAEAFAEMRAKFDELFALDRKAARALLKANALADIEDVDQSDEDEIDAVGFAVRKALRAAKSAK